MLPNTPEYQISAMKWTYIYENMDISVCQAVHCCESDSVVYMYHILVPVFVTTRYYEYYYFCIWHVSPRKKLRVDNWSLPCAQRLHGGHEGM